MPTQIYGYTTFKNDTDQFQVYCVEPWGLQCTISYSSSTNSFPSDTAVSFSYIVASLEEYSDTEEYEGIVFVYDINGNQIATINAPNPTSHGYFGSRVWTYQDFIFVKETTALANVLVYDYNGNYLYTLENPVYYILDINFGQIYADTGNELSIFDLYSGELFYTKELNNLSDGGLSSKYILASVNEENFDGYFNLYARSCE